METNSRRACPLAPQWRFKRVFPAPAFVSAAVAHFNRWADKGGATAKGTKKSQQYKGAKHQLACFVAAFGCSEYPHRQTARPGYVQLSC